MKWAGVGRSVIGRWAGRGRGAVRGSSPGGGAQCPGAVLVTAHSFVAAAGVIDSSWGPVTGGHARRSALSRLMSIDVLTRGAGTARC